MRLRTLLFCLWLAPVAHAFAQTGSGTVDAAPAATEQDFVEEVLVTGEQPGPGLWKISKDDRVLWVFGTLSPVPKKMTWRSRQVEDAIAQSDEVLGGAGVKVGLRYIFLLPRFLRMRKTEDKQTLEHTLPPDLYARFVELQQRYAPRNKSIGKFRPIAAFGEIRERAMEEADLVQDGEIRKSVQKLAGKHDVPYRRIEISVERPKEVLNELGEIPLHVEVDCVRSLLDRMELELNSARLRANAWATGDLQTLNEQYRLPEPKSCMDGLFMSARIRETAEHVETVWYDAVEEAFNRNRSTLVLVPVSDLFSEDGLVARYRKRGYLVEEP